MILKAMDVSSHQPRDLSALIAQYQPDHVIVKGYLPIESVSQQHSRDQVKSARNNGCTAGMYCWCYRSASPIATIDAIINLCASIDLELPLLWLDCETYGSGASADPGPDAEWLARAVVHAENTYQMQCGIYTGLWWIDGHFPGGQAAFAPFARLPQWWSVYDGQPDIDAFVPGAGVTQLAAKQYSGDPIDLSVIRSEYTVYQTGEPDPCAPVKAKLDHYHAQLVAWYDAKPYKAVSKSKIRDLIIS